MHSTAQLHNLSSGTQILIIPNSMKNHSTIIYFYFRVGSRNETIENNGISHFIEHLLFKGNSKYQTQRDITDAMYSNGVAYNAFTDKYHTGYYFKFKKDSALATICDLAHSMFFTSIFRESDISKEREVVIEEWNAVQNTPSAFFSELVTSTMYSNSTLELGTAGTPNSLKSISRKDILEYYRQHYIPNNLLISIGGNKPEHYMHTIYKYFGDRCGESTTIVPSKVHFHSRFSRLANVTRIRRNESPQALISMVVPIYGGINNHQRPLWIIMKNILGGVGMSSRLFKKIRSELGLVYSIRAIINEGIESGYLSIDLETHPTKINKCIDAVKEECAKISENGFSQEEMEKATEYYTKVLEMGLESVDMITSYYGELYLFRGKISTPGDFIKLIKSQKLDAVNELAATVLPKIKCFVYG